MRKTNTIIEINGRRYDTDTGASLTGGSALPPANLPAPAAKPSHHRVLRPPAHQRPAHPAAPSRTLMRQTVKKPGSGSKTVRHPKAQGPVDILARPPLAAVSVKASAQRLDEQRWRHAKHTPQSQLISHFSAASSSPYVPMGLPAPGRAAAQPAAAQERLSTKDKLLEHALKHARSHEELPPAKPRRHGRAKRKLGVGSAAALSAVVLGVVAVHNLPGARLQFAGARAGISASLPNWQPAGYNLSQLHYSSGVVSAQFQNGGEHYTLIQQRTSWNNAALLNNFVTPRDPRYQTAVGGGRTVYLYNQTNATWVSGGKWYVIQSDGSLSQQQLLDLATAA